MPEANPIAEQPQLAPAQPSLPHRIFLGPGGLRAGWGALLFALVFALCALITNLVLHLYRHHHAHAAPNPAAPATLHTMLIGEVLATAFVFIATFVMSRVERRPFTAYGLGGTRRLPLFAAGLFWGFAFISLLVFVLSRAHLLTLAVAAPITPHAVLKYGLGWLFAMLLTGFFEEMLMRGYLQWTLWRGLNFWWAAVILSAAFGLMHRTNPGESPVGLFSAGAIALIFCLSIWYTRSLWWAIGMHASWDWGETYFYGTPNSGMHVNSSLLVAHPQGALLMSGGPTGPEGSLLILPILVLITLVVCLTLREHGSAVSVD